MLIPLNMPAGERQRDFIDYLNAAMRSRMSGYAGGHGFRPDGRWESTTTGVFNFGDREVPLSWCLLRDLRTGELLSLEITGTPDAPPEAEWKPIALEFVLSVQAATLAARRSLFFHRATFMYIGQQLDGEYWLPGLRFAPISASDDEPFLMNIERVVVFDMNISAVDSLHARSLGDERAWRAAARLSLLLDRGLYGPEPTLRWARPWVGGASAPSSVRAQMGFVASEFNRSTMPKKEEICPLGKYDGSLTGRYRFVGLSLPPEARRILRTLDSAPSGLQLAFDSGARLYQVGAVVQSQFPSVGLAYRVAALDAISNANGSKRKLAEFVHRYAAPRQELDSLIDYLWGAVRSAHFHGGAFPLGEFSQDHSFEPFRDDQMYRSFVHGTLYLLTREVIVQWIDRELVRLHRDKPKTTEHDEDSG